MCLVLGTPGSGCTTFLKAIANERQGFYHVGGDIRYAGIDSREMAKTYKGELVYNAEGVLQAWSSDFLTSPTPFLAVR